MSGKSLLIVAVVIILLGLGYCAIKKPHLNVTGDKALSSLGLGGASSPSQIGAYINKEWGNPLTSVPMSKVFQGGGDLILDAPATLAATWNDHGAGASMTSGTFEFYYYPAGQLAEAFGQRALRTKAIDDENSRWDTEMLRYSGDITVGGKEVAWFVASGWKPGRYLVADESDAVLSFNEGQFVTWPSQVWLIECR